MTKKVTIIEDPLLPPWQIYWPMLSKSGRQRWRSCNYRAPAMYQALFKVLGTPLVMNKADTASDHATGQVTIKLLPAPCTSATAREQT